MSTKLSVGSSVWIPGGEVDEFDFGTVVSRQGSIIRVENDKNGKIQTFDLEDKDAQVYRANHGVFPDMTSLQYFHVPGILHNLRERSLKEQPYTFLGGSVLVAVNPLQDIPDPKGSLGSRKAIGVPHPYAIAETSYQQLLFSMKRGEPQDQSIVVGGESGAGKTESSKMVMKHLVQRSVEAGAKDEDLDRRLLETNPILEAFGNASTVRNPNSSRFGKFMKLHFKKLKKSGEMEIYGASVETYLLERSRVTNHGDGERTFHVFYQLVNGAKSKLKDQLNLQDASKYEYLKPKSNENASGGGKRKKAATAANNKKKNDGHAVGFPDDKKNFKHLCEALDAVGVSQDNLFSVVAALLHLGNVEFEEDEKADSGEPIILNKDNLDTAASLLGVSGDDLRALFIDRKVEAVGETITAKRDADGAKVALDAVVKAVYSHTFDWLVAQITESLSTRGGLDDKPFIGVLDIFGFESFRHNDFEQLLINYTNEALQNTFNKQVFEAEARLYEQEGMLVDSKHRQMPPDNKPAMALLGGVKGDRNKPGVLGIIDAETSSPQANDVKLNAALHRQFRKNDLFPAPHPKDVKHAFIIKHYAGQVTYTTGKFIEKNLDNLPQEVSAVFQGSSLGMVSEMFANALKKTDSNGSSSKKKNKKNGKNKTIAGHFKIQIENLIETLDATKATFIRCIKPNPRMILGNGFFHNSYVMNQLVNLSIPQTAEVLKGGLPTRLPFDQLVESYKSVLPKDAIKFWKKFGNKDDRLFVKALFEAFDIPSDAYKVGLTRVFFKSGMVDSVNEILTSSEGGSIDEEIVKRFKFSFARAILRRAAAVVLAQNRFLKIYKVQQKKKSAATIVQRTIARRRAMLEAKAAIERRKEQIRKEEEAKRRQRKEEERRKAEQLRKEQEQAAERKEKERLRLLELEAQERIRREEEEERLAHEREEAEHRRHMETERELEALRKKEKAAKEETIANLGGLDAYKEQVANEKKNSKAIGFADQVDLYDDASDKSKTFDDDDCGHPEEDNLDADDTPVIFEKAKFRIVKPPSPFACFARILGGGNKEVQWTECKILLAGIEVRWFEDIMFDASGNVLGTSRAFGAESQASMKLCDDETIEMLRKDGGKIIFLIEEGDPNTLVEAYQQAKANFFAMHNESTKIFGNKNRAAFLPKDEILKISHFDEAHWERVTGYKVSCEACGIDYLFLPEVENITHCTSKLGDGSICDAELTDPRESTIRAMAYEKHQQEKFNETSRKSMKVRNGFPVQFVYEEDGINKIINVEGPEIEKHTLNSEPVFRFIFPARMLTNKKGGEEGRVENFEIYGSWSELKAFHQALLDQSDFGDKLPDFPEDVTDAKSSKKRANARLAHVEKYMEALLKKGREIDGFFTNDVVQGFLFQFFNDK